MKKKILSEISLFEGEIITPKGWEINRDKIASDILTADVMRKEFPFSREWDKLNTNVIEYARLKHDLILMNKNTWGSIYKPKEFSYPLIQADPSDLKNAPDFILLYGVKVEENSSFVRVYYDDNRRKGRSVDIKLKNNHFVMFPSTQLYFISRNTSEELNFIQTITYEFA